MSASTLTLKLWSNFNRQHLAQLINIGDTWVIDPDGPILEPADQVDTTSAPGVLKIYHKVHPNSLVIHWMFPNLYVGHILWISQAPLQITKAQVDTVRCIERQLAKDWEYAARWEFIMCTPPLLTSHWDLERYTRSTNLPTVPRGRDQNIALEEASPETIEHYAKLLESRKHEFSDLDIDLKINRQTGLAYYTGNNGLRTYPLTKLGYHSVIRALCRVKAYRKKQKA